MNYFQDGSTAQDLFSQNKLFFATKKLGHQADTLSKAQVTQSPDVTETNNGLANTRWGQALTQLSVP